MTLPRERHLGTTYFITRRCERREFRLLPKDGMDAAFAVALVDACERYGCQVVALCVMSNHYHMVLHDPYGRVSELLRDVHATVGRYGNAVHGRGATRFWDGQQCDVVELGDADTVIDKVAYCLANPVRAGLVATAEEWPGLKTTAAAIGTDRGPIYRKPSRFFRKTSWVSESVELCAVVPPMALRAFGAAGFRRRVEARVGSIVERTRREREAAGWGVMGVDAVLAQSVWDAPKMPDERGSGLRAGPRRSVAARVKATLVALIDRAFSFRKQHAIAKKAFAAGDRSVEFPPGTWQAWRFYGARRRTPLSLAAA